MSEEEGGSKGHARAGGVDDGAPVDLGPSELVPGAYQGERLRIVQCEGALESLREALEHVPAGRRLSMVTGLRDQMSRHANGGRMSRENFPDEGPLPTLPGQKKGSTFQAYKRIPIRAYSWASRRYPGTRFVSHYIYKDQDRLDARDTTRVGRNWRRIEENGDER